ncbi:MAG: DUF1614 domain-containing protein [Thermoplasmata archaeon]|nr:DUF1614 domain-containing protein [Thermoplasmata archaeon]
MMEVILFIAFPLILMGLIALLFFLYSPTFSTIGMGKRDVGLLLLGSFSTAFFNMPVFVYKDYLLAFNIGGAIIPLILSFYLIYHNRYSFAEILAGIIIVGASTFMVTNVTEHGVVSYFPYFLIPSILSFLLALLLYYRDALSAGYAYIVATYGVIIGGDFLHLPEIFSHPFEGSIGGAGMYDMVYIAGLISFVLAFLTARKRRRDRREELMEKIRKEINVAARFVDINKYGIPDDYARMLYSYSFSKLKKIAYEIEKKIGKAMKRCYGGEEERVLAFLIDSAIIFGLSVITSIFHVFGSFIKTMAVSFFIYQLFYFIIMEYLTSTTIGKSFFLLEIRKENMEKADFMDIFTRNILRFLDMFAFFYALSLIMIGLSSKKQRIGDFIAGTVVARRGECSI